jgi:hypothetical protein
MFQARSDEEVEQIGEISREIVSEMLKMQGFIGWTGMSHDDCDRLGDSGGFQTDV